MYQATMSDTGEYIVGSADMITGILPIVYGCDYGSIRDALEQIDSGLIPFQVIETPSGEFGFVVTKKREK